MYTHVYKERRTYLKYDNEQIIGYLNEEMVENYIPEVSNEQETQKEPWATAYKYTGSEADGGTVMQCCNLDDYGEVANAIIRSRYSISEEMAIQRHALNGDYDEVSDEYDRYNEWCVYAVKTAKQWVAERNK